jgi:hypothetical protein
MSFDTDHNKQEGPPVMTHFTQGGSPVFSFKDRPNFELQGLWVEYRNWLARNPMNPEGRKLWDKLWQEAAGK